LIMSELGFVVSCLTLTYRKNKKIHFKGQGGVSVTWNRRSANSASGRNYSR
jgi:hypothetical protein